MGLQEHFGLTRNFTTNSVFETLPTFITELQPYHKLNYMTCEVFTECLWIQEESLLLVYLRIS